MDRWDLKKKSKNNTKVLLYIYSSVSYKKKTSIVNLLLKNILIRNKPKNNL